jgi:hypothetical protein
VYLYLSNESKTGPKDLRRFFLIDPLYIQKTTLPGNQGNLAESAMVSLNQGASK